MKRGNFKIQSSEMTVGEIGVMAARNKRAAAQVQHTNGSRDNINSACVPF